VRRVHPLKKEVSGVPAGEIRDMVEELRFALRRVLKWAEAYEPRRDRRRAYDTDLDAAEALLAKTNAQEFR
jgi:hypothetical protein